MTQIYDIIVVTSRGEFHLKKPFYMEVLSDHKQTKQTKERETNMKIKNFAFFGVMASILSIAGARADDTTMVIASQAYVDAKIQDVDVSDQLSGLVVNNMTNASSDTTHAASRAAINTALNDKVTKNNNNLEGATKTKITYDSKGLVTAGADLSASDIPDLTLAKISDAGTAAAADTTTDITSGGTGLPTAGTVYTALGEKVNTRQGTDNKNKVMVTDPTTGEVKAFAHDGHISLEDNTVSIVGIPTQTSQLTNNSGFITKDVNDLTNYTKTSDLANVATSGSYTDLSNTPTIPDAASLADTAESATYNSESHELTYKQEGAAGNSSKLVTSAQATKDIKAVQDYTDYKLNDKVTKNNNNLEGATKTKITYDSKGLVTAGADLSASDIPDLTLAKISDAGTAAAADTTTDITSGGTGLPTAGTVYTALGNKVTANSAITGATKTKITYDSKGLVTAGADLEASDIPALPYVGKDYVASQGTYTKGWGNEEVTQAQDSSHGATVGKGKTEADKYVPTMAAVDAEINEKVSGAVSNRVVANAAITASGTTNKIVQYDSKGLVVAGTTAGALATADAVSGGTGGTITDDTITNADIKSDAAILYTKMNNVLKDINAPTASTNATCNSSAPCVLSYDGSHIVWTNMDLAN